MTENCLAPSTMPDATRVQIYALGEALDARREQALLQALSGLGLAPVAVHVHAPGPVAPHALSLCVASAWPLPELRARVRELAASLEVDLVTLADDGLPTDVRLIVMDMDSTVITIEVIDELAKLAGVGEEVSTITAAAMRGELDFTQSLRRRVGLLRGLSRDAIAVVADNLPLNRGAEELVRLAKARGVKLALVSGGFTYFAERLAARLGFDFVAANRLRIEDGVLTGELDGVVVNAERKAELLLEYAQALELTPAQTVAVGDGANDLKMMAVAGLGVALHAKPRVQAEAPAAINHLGLEGVGYLLGWS